MNILSFFLNSSVVMWLLTFVCLIFCIRFAIYGVMGGTSTLLRIVCTLIFAALAYFFWRNASTTLNGSNSIDSFVYESWIELKKLVGFIKTKI